jgi:hypothetical protein
MAVPAFPLRPAVHARELRHRPTGHRRRTVGLQDGRGRVEPRCRRPDRTGGRQDGPLAPLGRGLRGPESRAARAGRRRCSQRHADPPPTLRGIGTHGGSQPALPGGGDRAGDRSGDQDHRGAGAAVPRARPPEGASAAGSGGERRARPARARGAGADRFRHARAELSRRRRRTTAARGDPLDPGRDRAPGGAQRNAELVASCLRRGIRGRARVRPLANGARGRLAHRRRMDDARAAVVHGLAVALVCDLGAAASRGQRRSAPAGRHARLLRLRGAHPPAPGRPAAQPARDRPPAHRRDHQATGPRTLPFQDP